MTYTLFCVSWSHKYLIKVMVFAVWTQGLWKAFKRLT